MSHNSDARFLRQEELIHRGLEDALIKRRISLRTSELCQEIGIASSTFYSHYRNCDEALVNYELELEEKFVRLLPDDMGRDLAFTLLLNFIAQHRRYFLSAFRSLDMYLLARLVRHICVAEKDLNRKSYVLYVWSVEAMIWCWGECDKFSERKKEKYREQLMKLRVMNYEL